MTVFVGLECAYCGVVESTKATKGWLCFWYGYHAGEMVNPQGFLGPLPDKVPSVSRCGERRDYCTKKCFLAGVQRLFPSKEQKEEA